ncbi:hypothetical protein [Microseira wollei]|uniref:Uncharacterized protein n=1 Tax=Microseira wollei NIES-4236 TaxID=2530354 RepID=A0AAV3XTC8_9CYAN|nr:hypothetical protein [Microseira wollei]GET44549.1 hypothetical protein MiSe_93790 [Microseira wollei NIES-4236]
MTQAIDDIIARFGQRDWRGQKARESFWVLRPQGTYNYKTFWLTYNPFTQKFQVVKPPNPAAHYDIAVKILGGSNRPRELGACPSRAFSDRLFMLGVPSMFPVKIDNLWINLALIRVLEVISPEDDEELIVNVYWDKEHSRGFLGTPAEKLLAESNKAWEIVAQRLSQI